MIATPSESPHLLTRVSPRPVQGRRTYLLRTAFGYGAVGVGDLFERDYGMRPGGESAGGGGRRGAGEAGAVGFGYDHAGRRYGAVITSGLLLSSFFLSSQYLQRVLGLSALRTGLVFLPVAIALAVGAHVGARVVGRAGGRPVAAAGFTLAAVGTLLLSRVRADGEAVSDVLPEFFVAGLGLGAAFVAATTTALAYADQREAGAASGLINTGHELGGALGVALLSTVAGASLETAVGTGTVPVSGFSDAFAVAAGVEVSLVLLVVWQRHSWSHLHQC